MGLLGVLVEAKQRGQVQTVRPLLQELRQDAGFWVSNALYNRILKHVNED